MNDGGLPDERVGDVATNIAEDVIYLETAELVRVFSRASWERFKLKRENVFSRRRRLMSKAPSGGVLKGLCKSV